MLSHISLVLAVLTHTRKMLNHASNVLKHTRNMLHVTVVDQ